jgi:nucleosome-remodeling factor subunit BPTF
MSYSLAQYPLAPHFWSQSRAKRNILITSQHDLRRLARTAGQTTSEGFKYDSKANPAFWPYPCPRPTFRTAWLYRTASMATLHSVAMQLRVLWMCLKWDDMNTKPPNPDGKNQVPVISSFSLQLGF